MKSNVIESDLKDTLSKEDELGKGIERTVILHCRKFIYFSFKTKMSMMLVAKMLPNRMTMNNPKYRIR